MKIPTLPFPWPGHRPQPYLITPHSEEEEKLGQAILVTPGEAQMIVNALTRCCPKVGSDLIDKYAKLSEDPYAEE